MSSLSCPTLLQYDAVADVWAVRQLHVHVPGDEQDGGDVVSEVGAFDRRSGHVRHLPGAAAHLPRVRLAVCKQLLSCTFLSTPAIAVCVDAHTTGPLSTLFLLILLLLLLLV